MCVGNWKMFKTTGETLAYIERFLSLARTVPEHVQIALCPPFTSLQTAGKALRAGGAAGRVKLGAQTMQWEDRGAYTGEISAPMLLDVGVEYVILGHSERRQYFGETDEAVRRKTQAALAHGLRPIVAVGEPLAVREAGSATQYVIAQVHAALADLPNDAFAHLAIAYEPIWAIGTGHNCDAAQANDLMLAIRTCLPQLRETSILYGGSVKAQNIAQYAAQPDIDGALVGGASLDPDGFAELCASAA